VTEDVVRYEELGEAKKHAAYSGNVIFVNNSRYVTLYHDFPIQPGMSVVYRNPKSNYVQKSAHPLLIEGGVYTVTEVEVQSWMSYVTLAEIAGESFNSVVFTPHDSHNKG
jgi:hypothetical protein